MENDTVTLVVESKRYEFSKKKLSECSGYFTAMFNSEFAEKNKSVITLEGVSVTSWEHILYFLTHKRIQQSANENFVEEMLDLLQAAAMFQFIDVQEYCSKILFGALNFSNAIPVLEIASRVDSTILIHKARTIALWNFDDVTKLDVFYKLNVDQVEGYISDPALHSWTGEWGVWEAIDRWLNSPDDLTKSRSEYLPRLIKCLHLPSLSLSDLRCIALYESVQTCSIVSATIKRIINERISAPMGEGKCGSEGNPEESVQVDIFLEDWRKTEPRKLPFVPSVVGNVYADPDTVIPYILKFCESEKKFIPVLRLNQMEDNLGSMVGFKVISNGSKLFILGGEMMTRQGAWNLAVWMYDQIQKAWKFLTNLLRPSRHLSACCVGNDLYVIGGFGRHRVVQDTVWKFSLKDSKWTPCAPLPRPVYSVPCCVFRNHIYVIESVIYQYIPSRDVWITIDVSSTARGFANAMANEDFIFLSEAYTRNIYKFNPSDSSSRLEILGTFKNECVQACLIDDHIYSLSQDEFGEDIYCEKLNIRTGESSVLWEGTTDETIADLNPRHHHDRNFKLCESNHVYLTVYKTKPNEKVLMSSMDNLHETINKSSSDSCQVNYCKRYKTTKTYCGWKRYVSNVGLKTK